MEPVNGSRQGFYLANVIRNLYMSVDIQTTGTAGNFNMKKCCVCQICVSELQLLFFSIIPNRRQWCVICSCLGCIQWMVYVFVSVFNPPHTHTHTCSAREWSEANVCSWSKCKWYTMLSVMGFFSFSHLCIFDVSQHITDSEALMSSALVWKKNWDSKWFTDENCQHHPCHSGNFEKNIASEPFVTRELWFWVSVDFRWSEIGNEERGWISPFSSTYTTVKKNMKKFM